MSKTRYYTATSLDGFIADPDNSLQWLFQVEDPGATGSGEAFAEFFAQVGAFCMGANTYEWMVAHAEVVRWQDSYGAVPCWVFTHRDLPPVPGADVRFVAGAVPPVYEQMVRAAGGKDIWVVGGGDLAGQFADHGRLDELILWIAPVTLGGGAPLLPRRLLSPRLRLTSLTQQGPFAALTYEVRG